MKKTYDFVISHEFLSQNALNALTELEERGFLVNGKISFDDSEESVVIGILDRVINTNKNYGSKF